MKVVDYNNIERHHRMMHPRFRFMRNNVRHNLEMNVYNVKIKDVDNDELYLVIPALDERDARHTVRRLFRCEIMEVEQAWMFILGSETHNEHELIRKGFVALENKAEKEADLDLNKPMKEEHESQPMEEPREENE